MHADEYTYKEEKVGSDEESFWTCGDAGWLCNRVAHRLTRAGVHGVTVRCHKTVHREQRHRKPDPSEHTQARQRHKHSEN